MTISRLLLFAGFLLVLSGCSIRGNIEDLSKNIPPAIPGEQRGFVSGATVAEVSQGYTVSASLGSYTDGIQQTSNGYTVYTGLQGSVSAEVLEPE